MNLIYENGCKMIIEHYGEKHQLYKLVEEMVELTQAIMKKSNVTEEMADVQVLLDQLKLARPLMAKRLEEIQQGKVKRQIERIKEQI